MQIKYTAAVCAAIFACLFILPPALAADNITEREKQNCRGDYQRFCKEYGLGSEALRACMSRSVKKLTNMCVAALVDAGDMTRAQADKLRHKAQPKHTTHKKTSHKSSHKKH